MATYPKVIKPWRGYPSANVVHIIRAHIQQANPNPGLGQIGLTLGVARHIGTIPRGAFVLPAAKHVVTAFAPTAIIDVGTKTVIGAFMPTAQIIPGTIGFAGLVAGTGAGYIAADTPVYVLMGTAQATAGELDLVIPFYINKD
jgi:hypothetical protein